MTDYDIQTDLRFQQGEKFDLAEVFAEVESPWFNRTLVQFDEAVMRLGRLHGEFHLHRHDDEDEVFFVLEGTLHLEVEGKEHILGPGQGFVVPKGVMHRTRAPEPVKLLMMARGSVVPTGSATEGNGSAARVTGLAPQFRVADVVATAEHYRDRLGFSIQEYFGEPPVFTQVERDGLIVQLGQVASGQTVTAPASGVGYNAYFWVDDAERLHRELSERKADIAEGPVERGYGCVEVVVRDLEGRKLCFGADT